MEYIIINKTDIQKRIEDLTRIEKELIHLNIKSSETRAKIDELISLVHQGTLLIPEIESAFDAGREDKFKDISYDGGENFEHVNEQIDKSDYVSMLIQKLNKS